MLNVTCQWSRSYCNLLESKKVVGNFESMKPLMMHSCIVLLSSIICSTLTLMNNPGYYLSEAEDIHHRFIPILHGYPSEQKEHSLETQKLSRASQKSIPVGSPTNVGFLGMIFVELLVMDADAQYDSNSETIEQTCIECLQHVHHILKYQHFSEEDHLPGQDMCGRCMLRFPIILCKRRGSQKDACKQRKLKISSCVSVNVLDLALGGNWKGSMTLVATPCRLSSIMFLWCKLFCESLGVTVLCILAAVLLVLSATCQQILIPSRTENARTCKYEPATRNCGWKNGFMEWCVSFWGTYCHVVQHRL